MAQQPAAALRRELRDQFLEPLLTAASRRLRQIQRQQRACPARIPGAQRAWRHLNAFGRHEEDADRAVDVFQRALAEVMEADRNALLHLLSQRVGGDDFARPSQLEQARRNIDGIAGETLAVDQQVADIQADAQPQLGVARALGSALQAQGPGNGIDGAAKLHEHGIARRVDQAPAVFADHWHDAFGAQAVPGAQSGQLVGLDPVRPAGDVGKCHRRQPSGDGGQPSPLP